MQNIKNSFIVKEYTPNDTINKIKEGIKIGLLKQVVNYDNYVAIKFNENSFNDIMTRSKIINIDLQFIPVFERNHVEVSSKEKFLPHLKTKTSLWKGIKNCFKYLKNRNNTYVECNLNEIKVNKRGD